MLWIVVDHELRSYVVAIDKRNGRELWKQDCDEPSNWSTPGIFTHAGRRQVVVNVRLGIGRAALAMWRAHCRSNTHAGSRARLGMRRQRVEEGLTPSNQIGAARRLNEQRERGLVAPSRYALRAMSDALGLSSSVHHQSERQTASICSARQAKRTFFSVQAASLTSLPHFQESSRTLQLTTSLCHESNIGTQGETFLQSVRFLPSGFIHCRC